MKKTIRRIGALLAVLCLGGLSYGQTQIDLSGTWSFALDREGTLSAADTFTDTILLPGTTDTNRKGDALQWRGETTHLSRRFSYKGRAWYSREVTVPESWQGKTVALTLERTKPAEVYVDGQKVGSSNLISTPQIYDLSGSLTPGTHRLTILVDNGSGVPTQLYANSHAYTEHTQTNWNGIIGRITLSTEQPQPIVPTVVHPDFRDFHIQGQHFYANGHRLFLRGKHDACVFPLTGHVPMDVDSWRSYLGTCVRYGLNHVRFHSWCPPEAAFVAADELGIILQPELPFWGDFDSKDSLLMAFLHQEGENIIRTYGHHPSFRMMALGNELWGDIQQMAAFVEDFRALAPDKFFTFGSNYYLGYQGVKQGMDYFTTCRVGAEGWGGYGTHIRGSFSFADAEDGGIINHFHPNAKMNFEEGCSLTTVPVISHETAQFQTYPDYAEIGKYKGVLTPCNLETFRDKLQQAGMLDQAEAFHRASGQWSLRLYKQDIEMDLRTPNMAGFQLLDLQDYPGQGSAYVGILDAFMETKGLCTEEQWRQWCSPVVPLLVADKYCFSNDERLTAKVQIANYSGQSLQGKTLRWSLGQQSGTAAVPDGEGLIDVADLDCDLSAFRQPTKLLLTLAIEGTEGSNTYELWVYPASDELDRMKKKVIITRTLTDEVMRKLERGKRVLLMPDSTDICVGGLFQTDYWNYRMFKTVAENNKRVVSPGTLGILCDPQHPLFRLFPTEEHSNWQWFPVVKNSHPMMLDNTSSAYRPLVQVIDNIERNHKLGLVFEFSVGKGKLLVVMSDLERAAAYPEGRAFYTSLLHYMLSADFAPQTRIT
ncbi:MAG: beta-glycosidase, partial [Bacteroidaceae bacterium]|nr:beta-glycosidase [Bacteroidaceae bacterium]